MCYGCQYMSKIFNGLELCSGPGGLSEGFMSVKYKESKFFIAVANDADENVSKTYKNNHSDTKFVLGSLTSKQIKKDIENAINDTVGTSNIDIVIGGPPCQGFSHANKKTRIMSNPLNRLSLDFLEMVKRTNPFSFVLENVPGILSMQNGKVMDHIIKNFQSLGYSNAEYWILNAADYGVPQKRKRVFVVGSKNSMNISPPKQTHGQMKHEQHNTVWNVLSDLPLIRSGHKNPTSTQYRNVPQNKLQKKLRNNSKRVKNHIVTANNDTVIERFRHVPQGGNWQNIPKHKMSTNGQYENMNSTHSGIYKRLSVNEPSVTITNFRKSMLIHPTQNRLLSVREVARLQTFPDTFEFHGTLSSMQQQVSDAVPVNLAMAVAKSMLKHMEVSLLNVGTDH